MSKPAGGWCEIDARGAHSVKRASRSAATGAGLGRRVLRRRCQQEGPFTVQAAKQKRQLEKV
jgi:hypothetical protein